MTTSQAAQLEDFYCPRCGGLMRKLAGSSFYWHAENDHRPCLITNIADPKLLRRRTADGADSANTIEAAVKS